MKIRFRCLIKNTRSITFIEIHHLSWHDTSYSNVYQAKKLVISRQRCEELCWCCEERRGAQWALRVKAAWLVGLGAVYTDLGNVTRSGGGKNKSDSGGGLCRVLTRSVSAPCIVHNTEDTLGVEVTPEATGNYLTQPPGPGLVWPDQQTVHTSPSSPSLLLCRMINTC